MLHGDHCPRDNMNWTRERVVAEISEKSKDLRAFYDAREIIRRRVLEVADSNSALTPLPTWSGTDAVLGSMDLAIHSMERTIEELEDLMSSAPVPSDRESLRAVSYLRIVGEDDVENR